MRQVAATVGISLPYLLSSVCIFFLDIFSAAYYSVDYTLSFVCIWMFIFNHKIYTFHSQSIGGSLTVLNVENRDEIFPIMSQVDERTRTFPSAIMMYCSLKFLIFLVVNILLIISIIPCIWDSLNENKRRKMEDDRIYILKNALIIHENNE